LTLNDSRSVSNRARWWPAAAIALGLAALVVHTLYNVLTVRDALPGRDSVNLYVWEIYTRSVLATGQLPFWNPFHFAGTPHLADVQTTVLYPPALLLRWLPPEAFLSSMAALHVWLAGAGTLFLGRVVGLSWWTAAAAAVAGMLGGSMGAKLHNGYLLLLYCASWLPWALGFTIVSARRATVWPHPALVLVLVLQFLAGYIQGSIYLVAAVSLYFVYSVIWPEDDADPKARLRVLGQLMLVGALSIGVSAFQLLPTARFAAQAARFSGIPYEEAIAEGGWSLQHLVTFFFPFYGTSSPSPHRDLAELVSYVGWILMTMVPLALLWGARRRITVFFVLLTAVALTIAITDLPVYRLHHQLFPGFRYPGRVLFIATLSVAIVGALGLERFIGLARERRWMQMAGGLAIGVVLIGVATVVATASNLSTSMPAPGWPWLPIASLCGVVIAGALASRAHSTAAFAIALTLIALDITVFTSNAATPVSVESSDRIRRWMGPPVAGRAVSTCENRIGAGEMLRNGQPGLDGLAGIILSDYSDWASALTSGNPLPNDGQFHGVDSEGAFPVRRDLLDAANVSLIYSCVPLDAPSLTLISHVDGLYVYRNQSARPRAFWTCGGLMMTKQNATTRILGSRFDPDGRLLPRAYVNVRWAPDLPLDGRRSLERRHSLSDGVPLDERTWRYTLEDQSVANVVALMQDASVEDTHGVDRATGRVPQLPVLLETNASSDAEMVTGTVPCEASGTIAVTVEDQRDGRFAADVQAPVAGYVFLSEPFYPERKAYVDGEPVTAVRANLAFTAVPVPAGAHRLEMRYVPDSFRIGLAISVLTVVGWSAVSWRRNRVR
jgi:hypothetical protein